MDSSDYQDIPSSSSNIDVGIDENEKEPDKVSRDQKSSPLVPFQQSPTTCENKRRIVPPRSCKNKKSEEDPGGKRLEKFITNVENNKEDEAFVVDQSKQIDVGESGLYEEVSNYEISRELGRGQMAGTVFAVVDKKTKIEMARKIVAVPKFKAEELRCLYYLRDTGFSPRPYIYQLKDGTCEIFMESMLAKTFYNIIADLSQRNSWLQQNKIRRTFALSMLEGLLTTVLMLNQKKWTHGDLHPGNVMVNHEMKIKFLDFGKAKKLKDDYRDFRIDIRFTLQKYIKLYLNVQGGDLHNKDRSRQRLDEVAGELNISDEDRVECLTLIDKCMAIREPNELTPFLEEVKAKYESIPERVNSIKKIMTILFADEFQNVHPRTPDEVQSSMDYTASKTEGCTVSQPEMDDGLQDAYKNLRITEKIDF